MLLIYAGKAEALSDIVMHSAPRVYSQHGVVSRVSAPRLRRMRPHQQQRGHGLPLPDRRRDSGEALIAQEVAFVRLGPLSRGTGATPERSPDSIPFSQARTNTWVLLTLLEESVHLPSRFPGQLGDLLVQTYASRIELTDGRLDPLDRSLAPI